MTHPARRGWQAMGASLGLLAACAQAADPNPVETLEIIGSRGTTEDLVTTQRPQHGSADSTQLLALLSGASVAENGALSGQLQYRGLSGPRLDVRVDGLMLPTAGPNWMDPPLHYVPAGLLHSVRLERGIAGPSSSAIGGAAEATWKRPTYADEGWRPWLDVDVSARGVDQGESSSALLGLAGTGVRAWLGGSRERGDDLDSADGSVAGTSYQRDALTAGAGVRMGRHSLDLALHRIESGPAGTPSLPMDIIYFDTSLVHGQWRMTLDNGGAVHLGVGWSDVEHGMANFVLRPAPDMSSLPLPPFQGDDRRFVDAAADSLEVRLGLDLPLAGGQLALGLDRQTETHSATVFDPDFAPFFVDNFNDVELTRWALHGAWQGEVATALVLDAGLRVSREAARADAVDAFPARLVDANPAMWPMGTPPRAVFLLREGFNSADRDIRDALVDWDLGLRWQWREDVVLLAGLARKSRAPLYQERFVWIPIEANAGLGDGNNYVGNPDLDPEVSHQVELGAEWSSERVWLAPRLFWRQVDDFIQGVPATNMAVVGVSANANGDPTPLRFANTEARLYGLDLAFGANLGEHLALDGNLAWVRGENTDLDDPLYRVAPAQLRVGLTWAKGPLQLRAEQVLTARQDRLSRTLTDDPTNAGNRFEETPGHGLTHLYASWRAARGLRLDLGVENVLDQDWTDHLSGFNRNAGGEVAVGERLPGRGRNLFARVHYRFD